MSDKDAVCEDVLGLTEINLLILLHVSVIVLKVPHSESSWAVLCSSKEMKTDVRKM